MTNTTEQTTITPADFYAPREHIRAALAGNGRGFYDHVIRAIASADSANLAILRAAYPRLTADVLAVYNRA